MIYFVRQNYGGSQFSSKAFTSLEKARNEAAYEWNHLTDREKADTELFIEGYDCTEAEYSQRIDDGVPFDSDYLDSPYQYLLRKKGSESVIAVFGWLAEIRKEINRRETEDLENDRFCENAYEIVAAGRPNRRF